MDISVPPRRTFLAATGATVAAAAAGSLMSPQAAKADTGTLVRPLSAPDSPSEPSATAVALARQLLLVGPDCEDLKLQYLKILIDDGLPRTATAPKKVLIVGAGIAGLTAALLLKRAGHDVTIVEANANRIGGRIKTYRQGPEWAGRAPFFADPAQHAEAGAMRIPDFHPLTLALGDKLGLTRRPFYLVDIEPDTGNPTAPPPAVTYRAYNGEVWKRGPEKTDYVAPTAAARTFIQTNGVQARRSDYAKGPDAVNKGFGLTGDQAGQTTGSLYATALDPVYDYISTRDAKGNRVPKPLAERIDGWARMIDDLGEYSMRRYLRERAGLSEPEIDAIGTVENVSSRMPLSFLHSFLDQSDINPSASYWEFAGGTAQLPYALLDELKDNLRMNRRVTRLEFYDPAYDTSGTTHVGPDGPRVWAQTIPEDGGDDEFAGRLGTESEEFTADIAIVTVPFSALRHVRTAPPLSYHKRRAVIELHYDAATKVLLEFSKRWWQFTEGDWKRELDAIRPGLYADYQAGRVAGGAAELLGAHPSVTSAIPAEQRAAHARVAAAEPRGMVQPPAANATGGGSVTDNPNRFIYNPSHPVDGSDGGVVLASYSWADDALRWDSLDDSDRYPYALRGMQEVYGQRIEVFYTGHGQTQSWLRNRYSLGEAAVFTPGQLTQLHPAITTPEGPLHFAGEHTSLKHAWIEGALESAVRTALEVHGA
jgi:monoamine oxidase